MACWDGLFITPPDYYVHLGNTSLSLSSISLVVIGLVQFQTYLLITGMFPSPKILRTISSHGFFAVDGRAIPEQGT
jgi:hypothetical protein